MLGGVQFGFDVDGLLLQVVGRREREGLEASGRGVAKAGFALANLRAVGTRPNLMRS